MSKQYIHKKYFAVPHNANALTKMHVRQANAAHFETDNDQAENAASDSKYAVSDFVLFAVLPAAFVGAYLSEILHRIFG